MPRRDEQGPQGEIDNASLRQQWITLLGETAPNADPAQVTSTFEDLVSHYTQPTRAYHTLSHIADMLSLIHTHENKLHDPNIVRLSTWFHDAVYNTRAGDNEEQSAALARKQLDALGINSGMISTISDYILATKSHDLPKGVSGNSDVGLFVDFDMSILAAQRSRYKQYATQVATEYGWAKNVNGADLYTPGRLQFLQGALTKPVFHTDLMKPLEQQAHENMEWEIKQLKKPSRRRSKSS